MSFANLPLLWVLGGRNNIFMWATGWSFATSNLFHRHIARVATVQGVAHSVLYTVIYIRGGFDVYPKYILRISRLMKCTTAANKVYKELSKIYILWGILVRLPHLDSLMAVSLWAVGVFHHAPAADHLVGSDPARHIRDILNHTYFVIHPDTHWMLLVSPELLGIPL